MPRNRVKNLLIWSMENLLAFSCPGCGKTTENNGLCRECRQKIHPIEPPHCPGCGGKTDGIFAECSQCLEAGTRPWDDAYAAFDYNGIIREMIVQLKFQHRPENGIMLAQMAAVNAEEFLRKYDLIVPVPLHFLRQMKRGYNQSEIISRELSAITGIPYRNLLRRSKYTAPQSRQNRQRRLKTLKNTFVLPQKNIEYVNSKHILLLDDVFTTGATLNAAACALQTGNPASIGVFTIARRGVM